MSDIPQFDFIAGIIIQLQWSVKTILIMAGLNLQEQLNA